MRLGTKLLLPLLLLSALAGGFLYVYWIPKAVAEREAQHIRTVERHLDSIADGLATLLVARELDTVRDILTELFKRNPDWKAIRLESAEGELLYPQPGMVRPPLHSADIRPVTRAVVYMGMDLGRLSVEVDMTEARGELQALHHELATVLLGVLAAVTLTLVLTLELAVRRPIRLLAAASRHLAQGQFGAPLPKDTGDEVGALAAGFAAMRDDIRGYQGELLQEIHERSEAEVELRQSNELLETMFSSIHVLVAYMDRDFNFVRVNRNYAAADGREPKDFVGKNHFALYPSAENEAIFRQVVQTGKPYSVLERPFEYAGHPERGVSYWDWALNPLHGPDGQVTGLVLSLLDVTERKLAESAREQLAAIVRSSRDAIIGRDLEGTVTTWNLGAQRTYGYSAQEMLGRPVSVLAPPERQDEARELLERVKRGETVEGYETERVRKDGSRLTVALTLSPIRDETGRLTGISTIARDVTELKRAAERLAKSMDATIRAIARTIEKRDPYTAGHQQRVAALAAAIAAEMGLPRDRIEGIRFGSLIHDIGKIYVPSEILNRPGRLEPYEFALIKTHPEVGYDIVKDVEFPWPVAQMILQHHERLDGSGYPKGLKGGEIVLEAQILAVADVVEAMGSHRPYRAALGPEAALNEIRAHRGRLYAPEAVDACLRLFEEKGFALAEAA